MSLNEKIAQVVKNLKEGTQAGSVRWHTTIDDGFITSRPDSSIVVEKRTWMLRDELLRSAPADWNYRVILSDANGTEVAVLRDQELPNPSEVKELYDLAASTKADELADAWLSDPQPISKSAR